LAYHQGTVWPLFTGWVTMAEYRSGHALAAFEELMSSVELTWAQDLGAVTEVLSGEFNEPLGRSSSHQLWSSAMVLSPAIRGMFGVEADVPQEMLHLAFRLPAAWEHARLHNVPFGTSRIELSFERRGEELVVQAETDKPETFCIATGTQTCVPQTSVHHSAAIPLDPVEIGLPIAAASAGSITSLLKVIAETHSPNGVTLKLEAPAGSLQELFLRVNARNRRRALISNAKLDGHRLYIQFPPGSGYQAETLEVHR
jgi:hypothetical protein